MEIRRLNWVWTAITILLILVIIVGGIAIWLRYPRSQPIEIVLPATESLQWHVYVSGAVSNPGIYPLKTGDTVENILRAAGGRTTDADLNRLKLSVPHTGEERLPQKIDINRAEIWLLKALPGIGDLKAQAIVDYRYKKGTFRSTGELTRVEGIGTTLYETIKEFITVSD